MDGQKIAAAVVVGVLSMEESDRCQDADSAAGVSKADTAMLSQFSLLLNVGQSTEYNQAPGKIPAQITRQLPLRTAYYGVHAESGKKDQKAAVACLFQHQPRHDIQQSGICRYLPCQIYRVMGRGKWDDLLDRRLGRDRQFGYSQACFGRVICHHDPYATGDSQDSYAVVVRDAGGRQTVGNIKKLFYAARAPSAVLCEQGIVNGVLAGQSSSMGRCSQCAQFRAANLDHDYRLSCQAGFIQGAPQLQAVAAALDVSHDHFCFWIVRHPADAVRNADVAFVAGGDPGGKPHPTLARHG